MPTSGATAGVASDPTAAWRAKEWKLAASLVVSQSLTHAAAAGNDAAAAPLSDDDAALAQQIEQTFGPAAATQAPRSSHSPSLVGSQRACAVVRGVVDAMEARGMSPLELLLLRQLGKSRRKCASMTAEVDACRGALAQIHALSAALAVASTGPQDGVPLVTRMALPPSMAQLGARPAVVATTVASVNDDVATTTSKGHSQGGPPPSAGVASTIVKTTAKHPLQGSSPLLDRREASMRHTDGAGSTGLVLHRNALLHAESEEEAYDFTEKPNAAAQKPNPTAATAAVASTFSSVLPATATNEYVHPIPRSCELCDDAAGDLAECQQCKAWLHERCGGVHPDDAIAVCYACRRAMGFDSEASELNSQTSSDEKATTETDDTSLSGFIVRTEDEEEVSGGSTASVFSEGDDDEDARVLLRGRNAKVAKRLSPPRGKGRSSQRSNGRSPTQKKTTLKVARGSHGVRGGTNGGNPRKDISAAKRSGPTTTVKKTNPKKQPAVTAPQAKRDGRKHPKP